MKAVWQSHRLWLLSLCLFAACASMRAADWPTFGHDPQRTGWATEETSLTTQNVTGFELKWKTHVQNEPKFFTALTAPVVATDVETSTGKKSLVFVAGSSNNAYALDEATGNIVWSRSFSSRVLPGTGPFQGTWVCPNGLNATPTIDRAAGTLYILAMDGRLFGLDLATGKDKFPPVPFIAPFAKSWSLNLVDGLVYTSLSQLCGDAASGFYSMDIANPRRPLVRRLLLSTTDSAGIWGRGGPVVGKNHRIYGLTADGKLDPANGEYSSSVAAASLPDLELVDYFSPRDWQQVTEKDLDMGATSPVWFTFDRYNLLAGGGKQAVLYLMDADSLGGSDHQSPLYTTPVLANENRSFQGQGIWGSLAFWKDTQGQSWVYVPIWGPLSSHAPKFPIANGPCPHGSILAFRVVTDGQTGKPTLAPAWSSGDFNLPDPPVIANGVLFALSTGENAIQTSDRFKNTRPATLHALDAQTGKVLYQSGNEMTTWVHFSGLAIANARVIAVDHDSWVYCFGAK